MGRKESNQTKNLFISQRGEGVKNSILKKKECEDRIENSVPLIAVWHLEASRVMTNGDPEGGILLSYPHTNNGFFFLLKSCLKSLNPIRSKFT